MVIDVSAHSLAKLTAASSTWSIPSSRLANRLDGNGNRSTSPSPSPTSTSPFPHAVLTTLGRVGEGALLDVPTAVDPYGIDS